MRLIEIRTKTLNGQWMDPYLYVAETVGAAFDVHAPDPAEGVTFEVKITNRAVRVIRVKEQS